MAERYSSGSTQKGEKMDRIKVIIADDSDFVRDGMKIILDVDDEFDVIGCESNGKEALELAEKEAPDVFLMDIQMPVMDGIEATKMIVEKGLGKVLILTTFDDDDLVRQALKNGAKGYLIKNHTPERLKQMIKSVHSGISVVEEKMLGSLALGNSLGQSDNNQAGTEKDMGGAASGFDASAYTEREMDIIRAVADGLSNREIADKLYISEGTVKNYITNILSKENLSHRTALAVYYLTGKK